MLKYKPIILHVPYDEKDQVKTLGAKWDPNIRKWYINQNICDNSMHVGEFKRWLPRKDYYKLHKYCNASDIGKITYCPYSYKLNTAGVEMSLESEKKMIKGTKAHSIVKKTSDSRCYIATHLYGTDHLITHKLRNYRDVKLDSNILGKLLVKIYYVVSPLLISLLGDSIFFRNTMRTLIIKILRA